MNTFIVSGLLALAGIAGAAEQKPNIVLILTDDIGWGDMQCYNPQSKIGTPSVDRLAREGMMFTHAHTPAALCAPTRYAMLTGNYPWRGRVPTGTWGFNVPSQLLPGQQTVATMLRTAGYRTSMFGKAGTGGFWAEAPNAKHLGHLAPIQWGFDYSFLIPRGHQALPHAFYENGVRADIEWDTSQVGEQLLAHALRFLDDVEKSDKPFYMHFCTDGAHGPYVPAPTLAGEPLKGVTKMSDHTDMIHETDILTGKLLAGLQQRGLLDNTLVVYTSDNGGLPSERRFGHDSVAGLRGLKARIFEGGTRVPFVVRWPGKIPAGTVRNQPIGTHDLVATALELAGVRVPAGQALDSVSLVPVLLGQRDDLHPVRDSLLVQSSPGRGLQDDGGFCAVKPGELTVDDSEKEEESEPNPRRQKKRTNKQTGLAHAVYDGDWKLVLDASDQPAALYHLATDLAEEKNLIAAPAQADRVRQMEKQYRRIRNSKRSVPLPDEKQ
ncbi:MAG: arylsulfatase [Planctomycetes bacterium]|nr:arylsulfatase [Planctomycetota bacterium]